ncbi:hypothetical protein N7481_005617 [Penicillium waksmanii]|uniref:uncharacterized protein n=1 Tax=Penicillium waksmanii TaxID=69791 RepID=UPI00254785FF|nr:uncharacterized protein N7481_005617 [Penicillium waksmanii]KAJ5983518.1 hypothetical protein N7481_005617 [Penicillium waksmanii]
MSDEDPSESNGVNPWPISPDFCPYKPFPSLSDLVRLDQITRFPQLNPQEMKMYQDRATVLWNLINNSKEGTEPYIYAFTELLGLSLLLWEGIKKFQKYEYGVWVRARKHEAEEKRLHELGIQRGNDYGNSMRKLEYELLDFSKELRLQVDAFQLYLPVGMNENEADRWIMETRLKYGNAIREKKASQQLLDRLAMARVNRQKAGSVLKPNELKDYESKMKKGNDGYSHAVMTLFNLRMQSEEDNMKRGTLCSGQVWFG